jgi:hypothetical protein
VLWLKPCLANDPRAACAQLHIYGAYTPPKAPRCTMPPRAFTMNWAEDALRHVSGTVPGALRWCGNQRQTRRCDVRHANVTTPIGAEAMHGEPWPGA